MKRKSKLLNVVSIIIIVFSSLGILGTLAGIAMSGMLEPYYETYGITVRQQEAMHLHSSWLSSSSQPGSWA